MNEVAMQVQGIGGLMGIAGGVFVFIGLVISMGEDPRYTVWYVAGMLSMSILIIGVWLANAGRQLG